MAEQSDNRKISITFPRSLHMADGRSSYRQSHPDADAEAAPPLVRQLLFSSRRRRGTLKQFCIFPHLSVCQSLTSISLPSLTSI